MQDEEVSNKLMYWDTPDAKEGWVTPVDGDNVTIKASWRMVVNVNETAKMTSLEVQGHLIIPHTNLTYPLTKINAEQIWFNRNGKVVVGTDEVLLGNEIETEGATFDKFGVHFDCRGNTSESTFVISPDYDVGYNVIATTIDLTLKGRRVRSPRSFLVKPALAGAKSIEVRAARGWNVGD
jgi:hypothetical protein